MTTTTTMVGHMRHQAHSGGGVSRQQQGKNNDTPWPWGAVSQRPACKQIVDDSSQRNNNNNNNNNNTAAGCSCPQGRLSGLVYEYCYPGAVGPLGEPSRNSVPA